MERLGWGVLAKKTEEKLPYRGLIEGPNLAQQYKQGWVIPIIIHLHSLNLAAGCGTSVKMLPNSTASDCLFQPLWDYLLSRHYTLVSSPFFPVLLAFSSYFIFSIPFAILDVLGERAPLFEYKIQKQRRPTVGMMLRTLGTMVYNHLVFVLPGCVDNQCGDACTSISSTCSNREQISSALGVLLMFDTQYFFWHTKTLTCTDGSTPSIMITSHRSLGLPSNSALLS